MTRPRQFPAFGIGKGPFPSPEPRRSETTRYPLLSLDRIQSLSGHVGLLTAGTHYVPRAPAVGETIGVVSSGGETYIGFWNNTTEVAEITFSDTELLAKWNSSGASLSLRTSYYAQLDARTFLINPNADFVIYTMDAEFGEMNYLHLGSSSTDPNAPGAGAVRFYSKGSAPSKLYVRDSVSVKEILTDSTGAPSSVDYLVGTASASLSGEIVVGTAPAGELGGTWASPTVDATHSGSAHHAQSHDHSAGADGTTLTPATLNIPYTASPGQTNEGSAVWDSDDDVLTIGTGASRKTFGYVGATVALGTGTAAAGTSAQVSRVDHVHPQVFCATFDWDGTLSVVAGQLKWYNDTGRTLTFLSARGSVGTAPTDATLIVDVNSDGTSVWTGSAGNRIQIATTTFTDEGAAFVTETIADGSYLTADIDQVGSTVAGADLRVQVWMTG